MRMHPARRRKGVFRRSGKLVLRDEAIIDGDDQKAAAMRQAATQTVEHIESLEYVAATMR